MNLLDNIQNPICTPRGVGVRDAAILWHEGVLHCFYTASFQGEGTIISQIEHIQSRDLRNWERCPDVVTDPPVFWSVGNVIRANNEWVLCMQDYRIPIGEKWAGDDARLWLTRSADLMTWGDPVSMNPVGAQVQWRPTQRQIDPYIVEHEGRYYCFYKGGGLGLLVSEDLITWKEASPERPVFSAQDTPDGSGMENACVVRDGDEFVLFFAPNRVQRGVGTARSKDLFHWYDTRYFDLPKRPWMIGHQVANAAMVVDARQDLGAWLMVFHSDDDEVTPHSGVLALAWSENLVDWHCP